MEILLDTNFVLTCVKEKLDFLETRKFGKVVIPKQVLNELEKLEKKTNGRNSENAELALRIIKDNKEEIEFVELDGKFADSGIVKYAENNDVVVATLDRELKKKLRGKAKIVVIRGRKKIEII
ncbi:MAG: PIN domain-containing protein [Nanoarchaeota archaeon]|nr:hypothetical protein [Nanoarchaeota archaeon]